jgi:CII-binding regulator of phage lambda lysogenization HflD
MYEVEGMEELVKSTRGREEKLNARIRQLESTVRRCEEEKKMVEMCVKEYADLVRGWEGRFSLSTPTATITNNAAAASAAAGTGVDTGINGLVPPEESVYSKESSTSGSSGGLQHSRTPSTRSQSQSHSPSHSPSASQSNSHSNSHGHSQTGSISLSGNTAIRPIDSLQEGRMGLQRLLGEFHKQTGQLEEEIAKLHGELEMMEMRLEQKEKLGMENEREIGRLKGELMATARADKSASMMVEKYMCVLGFVT